jgi:proline dehydrogenase
MVPPIVNNYVAGEEIEDVLQYCKNLTHLNPIVNHLGEHYEDNDEANSDTEEYINLLEKSSLSNFCISVKPTQIGLEINKSLFKSNLKRILDVADNNDVFVWLDMEDNSTTRDTIDVYNNFSDEYDIGICLQANLRRTMGDISILDGGKVRIVKGGYDEDESIAYTDKEDIDENYVKCMKELFMSDSIEVAVATHDKNMIDKARSFSKKYDKDFETQMLMGLREDLQRRLAKDGLEVYQYIPYGSSWKSYFYRRLKEKRSNYKLMLRSLLDDFTGSF